MKKFDMSLRSISMVTIVLLVSLIVVGSIFMVGTTTSVVAVKPGFSAVIFHTVCGPKPSTPVSNVSVTISWTGGHSPTRMSNINGTAKIYLNMTSVSATWKATYPHGGVETGSVTTPVIGNKTSVHVDEPTTSLC